MGFPADRTQGHGPGAEALDDAGRRLHLLEGDGIALELEQAAQGADLLGRLVDQPRKAIVLFLVVLAHGNLQRVHRLRVDGVVFAVAAKLVLAAHVQKPVRALTVGIGVSVALEHLAAQLGQPDPGDA